MSQSLTAQLLLGTIRMPVVPHVGVTRRDEMGPQIQKPKGVCKNKNIEIAIAKMKEKAEATTQQVIDCIREGKGTAPQISKALGMSQSNVCKKIRELQAKKVIEQIGINRRAAVWGMACQ